ncbi:biotin--[acetyl-CoA-carboxylase] ligase [Glaciimonas sp. PCH181]|uniref:biotin--[acetyl-CoA-carboxylase] ligase n=1 Tax=Glaciimonas sp. PCH181 TaxID=2133943 RepID=UPI000D3AE228|nr:biotin--[acetyl-CoA-carboxylase] ligase [Glaciimonas sp. PCH181]PUA18366.1 biotin--[acetyl-CoA-carboxylase] ligase [Glaciimonas sp. PCH181]
MTSSLSAELIFALSTLHPDQITIEVVAETGSTNADLLARIQAPQANDAPMTPMLLIAEQQTAGRGRAGRTWLSAPSAALMFSLAWRFEQPLQKLVGLPLAIGVAIVTALNTYLVQASGAPLAYPTDHGIRLKWPNDLLLNGAKLGGILIETANGAPHEVNNAQSSWAVIGVGINIAMPTEMQHQLGRSVANLPLPPAAESDRNLLMATLLRSLRQTLEEFEQHGLAPFVPQWNQLHAHAGQQVVILDQGKVLHEGTALGIDEIGRFLLQTSQDGRPIAIMAGDISLRAKEE